MNPQLKKINEILSLCDAMIAEIQDNGILYKGNANYEEYKARIKDFLSSHHLMRNDYGLYAVLDSIMTIYDILKDTNYKAEQFSAEAIDRLNARIEERTDKREKCPPLQNALSAKKILS